MVGEVEFARISDVFCIKALVYRGYVCGRVGAQSKSEINHFILGFQRDKSWKSYISKVSFQPQLLIYTSVKQNGKLWSFCFQLFVLHSWFEYSNAKNAMCCVSCYLFVKNTQASRQFVIEVLARWNTITKKDWKLAKHVGKHTSAHSLHFIAWKLLPNQHFFIDVMLAC